MNHENFFEKIKKLFFFMSFLYLTLFLPFLIVVYSFNWYDFNYNNQDITKQIDNKIVFNSTKNLISFFMYETELNNLWNEKEKAHMADVRQIYTFLNILGVIMILLFMITFQKDLITYYSKINLFIFFGLSFLLPFFVYLFNTVFHEILFSNNFWIINSNDISYYLFPVEFFRNSFLFILIISIVENLIVYFISKNYN